MDYNRTDVESMEYYDRGENRAAIGGAESLAARVYTKLTLSVMALAGIEAAVFAIAGTERILRFLQGNISVMGIALLALCFVGSFVGNYVLSRNPSRSAQYGLLVFYTLLEAAILFPILAIAGIFCGAAVIWEAVGLTACLFMALSAAVFITRKDFTFLRSFLIFTGFAALILIVASLVFGFNLGVWFSGAMIFLACGYVLYDTSNMLHHATPNDDIICTIALLSTLSTLFFYILRLLVALNRR